MDSSKYVRYTPEQVEALERVYSECPKPSSLRRQQLIRECPILSNIEPKQIKVWFQNRRYKQIKSICIPFHVFGFLIFFQEWVQNELIFMWFALYFALDFSLISPLLFGTWISTYQGLCFSFCFQAMSLFLRFQLKRKCGFVRNAFTICKSRVKQSFFFRRKRQLFCYLSFLFDAANLKLVSFIFCLYFKRFCL